MEIIKFIQSFSNEFLDVFFLTVTALGGQTLGVLLGLYFYWCVDKRIGYKMIFILNFSLLINNLIKIIVNRSRPLSIKELRHLGVDTATGSSFPSGHAQGTATTFTTLFIEFKKLWLALLGTFLVILVAVSRLYLGVHWPSDVACGILFGIISTLIGSYIFDYVWKKQSLSMLLIVCATFTLLCFFYQSLDYMKALGTLLSLTLGFFIETKYIRFHPHGQPGQSIAKLCIGILGFAAIHALFKYIMPETNLRAFLCYFSLGIWCTILAPIIFIKLGICPQKKEKRIFS